MSEKQNVQQLREEVNPVFSTAQSCLQITAAMGDEESEKLRKILGFTRFGEDSKERAADVPPQVLEALIRVMLVFNSHVEGRFFGINNYLKETGARQVLDLPCGYTARGIKLAESHVKYFGADLPAVIDAFQPAVKQVIGDNPDILYQAVDATNYDSLRQALGNAQGELTITTEGLLIYFTQPELETVFGNIRRLLLEFGGRWITPDNELHFATEPLLSAILGDMPADGAAKVAEITAGIVAKTTLSNNVFFDKNLENAKKFVSDMGFDLELVPMGRYLPEKLAALSGLSEEVRRNAMKVLGAVNFWVMTPKAGISENYSCNSQSFQSEVNLNGDLLHVRLAGRLDTITSPDLLALFKQAQEKGTISHISVDMKELEYVSSAGLRVLMIMRKAVTENKDFSLINMNQTVRDIIETTGFDTIFC